MTEQRKEKARPSAVHVPPILVDRETAAAALNLGVSTFMREVRLGRLPQPRRVSPNRVGWLWSELVAAAHAMPLSDLMPPAKAGNRARRKP